MILGFKGPAWADPAGKTEKMEFVAPEPDFSPATLYGKDPVDKKWHPLEITHGSNRLKVSIEDTK